jgi:DNA-binding transcriptional MerR regulator
MSVEPSRAGRTFTIRQLCEEFGCTARALRFYEGKGMLAPARQGLNRIYSHRDRGRLRLILRGKRMGLPLSEIHELLELREVDHTGLHQAARSLHRFQQQIVTLQAQRQDIDFAIADLEEAVARLEQHLANLGPNHPESPQ